MSGRMPQATSSVGPTEGGSRRKLTVDADDVTWQQNADDVTLEHGCLILGDEDIGEDNNSVELRTRPRFPSWLYATCSTTD